MKLAVTIQTPDVGQQVPVALLEGSFAERVEKASRLGYDALELMVVQPADLDAAQIRSQAARRHLDIAAVSSGALAMAGGLTLLAPDPGVRQAAQRRLHDLIQFASRVGSPLVTIGGFRGRCDGLERDAALAMLSQALIQAADRAAEVGVRLVVEPLNRYESKILNTAEATIRFLNQTGHSHIGLLLDTFHMNIEEPSISRSTQMGMEAGRLWHLHLGDSNRCPPGKGHIDFLRLVETLKKTGYRGALSAELLPCPTPDQSAQDTIEFMRKILPVRA